MQPTPEMIEREAKFASALRDLQSGTEPVILTEILHERVRQQVKWGEQNHPSFGQDEPQLNALNYGIPHAGDAIAKCDAAARAGLLTWGDILIEEVAEAYEAPDEDALRAELIQVAAVAHAWIACMDRRKRAAKIARLKNEEKERRAALTEEERRAEDAPVEAPPAPEPEEERVPYQASVVGRVRQLYTCDRPVSMDEADWMKQAEHEMRVHLKSIGIEDVENIEIVEVKPATVIVSGHSDDCIKVEGDIEEEFTLGNTDENALIFDDGTVLKVTYTGEWIVEVIQSGPSMTFETVESEGADSDNYTDRVTLTFARGVSKVELVKGGEPCE